MRTALTLARRGLGCVAPNPAVGCLLVKDEQVIARGWTQAGGRPHAEAEALARAGEAARGATAYVSLEPCAHQGETPPCAQALVAAGITRAVIALGDPDPRVSGRGIALLREVGVELEVDVLAEEAAELNAGYLMRVMEGRPLIALKLASTLDGRIATISGESRWITGSVARTRAHLLRANFDAVLVGSETAMLDDPRLDVRLAGLEARSPQRVVLDGRLRLPLTHDLVVRAGEQKTYLLTRPDNEQIRLKAYQAAGLEVVTLPDDSDGNLSLEAAARALGARGVTRLLVEGGGKIAAGFLRQGLVDRLIWFRAPGVIGADGIPAVAGFNLKHLDQMPKFELLSTLAAGEDLVETYRRVA